MINRITEDAPLMRGHLDRMQCDDPACPCAVLSLTSFCHPGAPMQAAYTKADGTLMLECAACGEPALVFLIAREN